MRDGGPEKYGEVVKQLQGRTWRKLERECPPESTGKFIFQL